jgi:ribonucleoside-diphosphate reductase alpha chain
MSSTGVAPRTVSWETIGSGLGTNSGPTLWGPHAGRHAGRIDPEVGRHLPLTTEHGHSVEATDNHEFPTLRGRLKLRDIRPGDVLMLQSGEGRFGTAGTYSQGLLLGLLTGDGCVHDGEAFIDLWEDDFGDCDTIRASINEEVAKVPLLNAAADTARTSGGWHSAVATLLKDALVASGSIGRSRACSAEHVRARPRTGYPSVSGRGLGSSSADTLHGIFHSDGSVQCQHRGTQTSLNLRLTQANRDLLADVQILLQNFGVVSRLYARGRAGKRLLPDGRGGTALYECREVFELVVNRPNLARFMRSVRLFGRKDRLAQDLLDSVGWNSRKPERFQTRVVTIEWAAKEDVYCLYEPKTPLGRG